MATIFYNLNTHGDVNTSTFNNKVVLHCFELKRKHKNLLIITLGYVVNNDLALRY